jgi:hypothetical protein
MGKGSSEPRPLSTHLFSVTAMVRQQRLFARVGASKQRHFAERLGMAVGMVAWGTRLPVVWCQWLCFRMGLLAKGSSDTGPRAIICPRTVAGAVWRLASILGVAAGGHSLLCTFCSDDHCVCAARPVS